VSSAGENSAQLPCLGCSRCTCHCCTSSAGRSPCIQTVPASRTHVSHNKAVRCWARYTRNYACKAPGRCQLWYDANTPGRCRLSLTAAPAVACAAELTNSGATTKGFAADLSDAAAVKATIAAVRDSMGPVSMLHWNPYQPLYAPLLDVTPAQLQSGFNVSVKGGWQLRACTTVSMSTSERAAATMQRTIKRTRCSSSSLKPRNTYIHYSTPGWCL
jgi:hypothetical protein